MHDNDLLTPNGKQVARPVHRTVRLGAEAQLPCTSDDQTAGRGDVGVSRETAGIQLSPLYLADLSESLATRRGHLVQQVLAFNRFRCCFT
jgi:hypothetical protein